MTADDPEPLRSHVRTKAARKRLAERFKAPDDDLRLVIVCDMWLTDFDCPPAHTMYLDKPLARHNLMEAIARVNRVHGDKPGGLIVDLLGLADQLADAPATYTQAGGTGEAVRKVQDEAVPAMLRRLRSCATSSMAASPATSSSPRSSSNQRCAANATTPPTRARPAAKDLRQPPRPTRRKSLMTPPLDPITRISTTASADVHRLQSSHLSSSKLDISNHRQRESNITPPPNPRTTTCVKQ